MPTLEGPTLFGNFDVDVSHGFLFPLAFTKYIAHNIYGIYQQGHGI